MTPRPLMLNEKTVQTERSLTQGYHNHCTAIVSLTLPVLKQRWLSSVRDNEIDLLCNLIRSKVKYRFENTILCKTNQPRNYAQRFEKNSSRKVGEIHT